MKSSKISEIQNDLNIKICKAMKPEERLVAFVNHSRLVMQMYQAGVNFRVGLKNALKQRGGYKKDHES